jgi:hypothetical protein
MTTIARRTAIAARPPSARTVNPRLSSSSSAAPR